MFPFLFFCLFALFGLVRVGVELQGLVHQQSASPPLSVTNERLGGAGLYSLSLRPAALVYHLHARAESYHQFIFALTH
jgi:hypothetical protein